LTAWKYDAEPSFQACTVADPKYKNDVLKMCFGKIEAVEHSAKSWFLARYFSIRGVEGVVDFRPTIVIIKCYLVNKKKSN